MFAIPVALALQLVRIGNGQAAEQNRFPLRIDELVSFYGDERHLRGIGGVRPPAHGPVVPPLMHAFPGGLCARQRGGHHRKQINSSAAFHDNDPL